MHSVVETTSELARIEKNVSDPEMLHFNCSHRKFQRAHDSMNVLDDVQYLLDNIFQLNPTVYASSPAMIKL